MKTTIIPILMCEYRDEIEEKVDRLKKLGIPKLRVQLDVIDGIFAPVGLLRPEELVDLDWGDLEVEVQLMVEEPVEWLSSVYQMGAKRVYGHIERMGNREEFTREAREYGLEWGWGLDLYTPVNELTKAQIMKADGIVVMTVKTGASGQLFENAALDKVKKLREIGFLGDICVDGGVNGDNIEECIKAGANNLSMNSALWKAKDLRHTYIAISKRNVALDIFKNIN